MTKELEAFRDILGILSAVSGCEVDMDSERIKIVNQALQRLEAIENANPSEALKDLEIVSEFLGLNYARELNTIKQYILKAQEQDFNYTIIVMPFFDELVNVLGTNDIDEMLDKIKKQEKVLEIMFEKNVDVIMIRMSETLDKYNRMIYKDNFNRKELTKDEFDLLKRWLDE